jgi:AcrR family transcriptional regulator
MTERATARRGRRRLDEGPALRQDQLVAILLDLASREGAEAVNMRRVAAEAAVSPRLLYSMVRDKTEMVDLLCEAIIAQASPTSFHGSWQDRLRAIARSSRRGISRYSGVPRWMLSRAGALPKAPQSRRSADEIHRALEDAGLRGQAVHAGYLAFAAYTLGHLVMTEGADPNDETSTRERLDETFEAGLQMLIDGFEAQGAVAVRST